MQFELLSDHAGDQLRQAATRQDEAQRYAQHSEEQAARADADYREARRARPLWKRVLGVGTSDTREAGQRLVGAQRQSSQARELVSDWEHAVDQHGAGVAGERTLALWLGTSLSDEWVGFGGYKNKRGEADLVLVGPPGVWVVEVKNRKAQLFANGDQWHYRKFDNYGNVVDGGPATDRKGRTWGQQASQVAESLSWWLGHNQLVVPVRTAVVLVHPKASVAVITSPGVDVVTADPRDLFRALTSAPPIVGNDVREQVMRLVRRDHAHHDPKLRDGTRR
jgi:Nuclease-related domain